MGFRRASGSVENDGAAARAARHSRRRRERSERGAERG